MRERQQDEPIDRRKAPRRSADRRRDRTFLGLLAVTVLCVPFVFYFFGYSKGVEDSKVFMGSVCAEVAQ